MKAARAARPAGSMTRKSRTRSSSGTSKTRNANSPGNTTQATAAVTAVAVAEDARHFRPLVIFEDARRQIADAETVDQVKKILVMATGLAVAARKATNREMEAEAEILKMEAVRRLGQIMAAQKATVGLHKGGRPKTGLSENPVSDPPTLAEAGIDKNLAHRSRRAAAMSDEQFEDAKTSKKATVSTPSPRKNKRTKNRPKQEVAESTVSTPESSGLMSTKSSGTDNTVITESPVAPVSDTSVPVPTLDSRTACHAGRDDVGPYSSGEIDRLRERVDRLNVENRRLEIRIAGLESEIAELQTTNAGLRQQLEAGNSTAPITVTTPADDEKTRVPGVDGDEDLDVRTFADGSLRR